MITVDELHEIKRHYLHVKALLVSEASETEKDTALREMAARMFCQVFPPHNFHPADMLLAYSGTEEGGVVTMTVRWDPQFTEGELLGGPRDGMRLPLQFPHSTVTTGAGVGTSTYHLSGFNTETRRHVFTLEREGSHL